MKFIINVIQFPFIVLCIHNMLNGRNSVRDDFKTTVPVPAGFCSK